MKKALMIAVILCVAVISTACINNMAVQELNNKAAEYMQKGDYESAMNRLQASLDLDSSMYETYYNLGVAALHAKKYKTAIEALENGIKIKPDYGNFYYTLGVAQISYADDILDEDDSDDSEENKTISSNNDSENADIEVKAKAIELKKSAIDNLNKYIEISPNAEDIDTIKEMIVQSEQLVNEDDKTEEGN